MRILMSLFTLLIAVAPLLIVPLSTTPKAAAHAIDGEPAGFSPSFLISDNDFINSSSMSGSAINDFLLAKGSWLANYTIPEYINVTYFCYNTDTGNNEIRTVNNIRQMHVNGTTPLYGMRVADLIAERAQAIGLNPQVILTLLQRESTAITRSSPSSDTTRTWPLFYGFNDTMKNFGYTCASGTAAQLAQDYGGLGQQIAYATYSLRNRYNNANDWQTSSCSWSGGSVSDNDTCFTVSNRASRALYVYTPAVHTGNHNFWHYFISWFTGVSDQPVANIRAIRPISSDTLYLHDLAQNKRYEFTSMADFAAWGFSSSNLTVLDNDVAGNIPIAGRISRLVKPSNSHEVYYIENRHKHHVRTGGIFSHYGLSWQDLATVPAELLNQTPTGPAIGGLMKSPTNDDVFMVSNGRKWYIPNAFVMNSWGYDWRDIDTVPASVLASYPRSDLEVLMKSTASPVVYAMSGGKRYAIPDLATFTSYGFSWSNLATVGEETKLAFESGGTLTRLVKGSAPAIYFIENSRKRHVTSSAALSRTGLGWGSLIQISDGILNVLPTGPSVQ